MCQALVHLVLMEFASELKALKNDASNTKELRMKAFRTRAQCPETATKELCLSILTSCFSQAIAPQVKIQPPSELHSKNPP